MNPFLDIMKGLGIRCNESYAKELFYAQGYGFTLLGMKRMLEHYGVKVQAVCVEKPSLDGLTFPLVCQWNERLKLLTAPPTDLDRFYSQWDGYALLCDASEANEPDYWNHFICEKLLFLFPWAMRVLGVLTLLGFLFEAFTWERAALVLFNLLGLYFSYRTVMQECSGSCHTVTASAGGKLLGRFSLGVVGMAYFSVSLLPTLFVPAWLPLWRWIALIAVVMPLWSLCYQAFVVKAWCKNCLMVQAQVVASALVVGGAGGDWTRIAPLSWVALPAAYLSTLLLLDRVVWLYQQVKQPKTPAAWLETLSDPLLRQHILQAGQAVDTSNMVDLLTLHPEGTEELCVALSLTCSYCKANFQRLMEQVQRGVLANYRIRLAISPDAPRLEEVREAIAASARQEGALAACRRLSAWYDLAQVKRFRRTLPATLDVEAVRAPLAAQAAAVGQWHLRSLPAFVLNGHVVAQELFWATLEIMKQ